MKLSECSITGLIFASVCLKSIASISCPYDKKNETANCQNKGLTKVPTDLYPSTKELDLSSNPIKLTENSFQNLTSLTKLIMKYVDLRERSAHNLALMHLKKLKFLDLTGSKFDAGFEFLWPQDNEIKTLIIDDTSFDYPNLEQLEQLEKLSAKNCSIEVFPRCHYFAPLVCVDLTNNPMGELTVIQISYFCLLEKLFIEYPASGSLLATEEKQCQCVALQKWAENYNLKGMQKLECYKGAEANCVINFTTPKSNMDACTKRVVRITPIKEIFLGILLAIVFYTLLFVIYRRCIAPFFPSDENKPSTTPRPRKPTPKTPKPWSAPRIRVLETPRPRPVVPGEEEEEED